MRAFVLVALVAAWICAVTATPLPSSRYSDSEGGDQAVYKAEDHLFSDSGFPLRVRARTHAFAGFGGGDSEDSDRLFPVSSSSAGDQTPFNIPMNGFFYDMHDMMKILRDQMTEVLARVPESTVGHDDRLRPSDVKNQTTSKVEILDGHKVVINDTTYSNGDTNHGSIFHVQIVDLLPLDPEDSEHPAEDPTNPAEEPEHPAEEPAHPAEEPSTPKTKISNEIDTKKAPEDRDREEVEPDTAELDEDIDEVVEKDVKPKPAKKVERKEAKDKVSKGVEKKEEKAPKEEKVEKREKVPSKEVEVFDDELERAEDEEEEDNIPDREEKKKIHFLIRL